MSSISQIFRLASTSSRNADAIPVTYGVKTTPTQERANLAELEDAYLNDSTVHRGIDNYVSIMMSAGYNIIGSDQSVSNINEFLDTIGTRGGNTDWNSLLKIIFKHQAVYGRGFNEIIYDKSKESVLDLDFIDPKKMDYAKNAVGRIVLNKYSNSVGWVETIPTEESGYASQLPSDKPPKEVALLNNQIFFTPDRIAHYRFSQIGDGFYGVGLVEPILNISKWKRTMQEAISNVYFHSAFPIKTFRIGDISHEPTADLMKKTLLELQDTSYKSTIAVPYYVEPTIMEAKTSDVLSEHLDQFTAEQVTMLGPSAFVTGSGKDTNKSVLARQEFLFKLTIRDIMKATANIIETQIFAKIAERDNLPDVPKILWGEINLEELDSKADRLIGYVTSGIVTMDDDIESLIRKFEGLPELKGGGGERERNAIRANTDAKSDGK